MKYVIECAFTYGWDILNEDEPAFYDSAEEAQAAIDDLIADTKEAFEKGDMDEAYDPEDFRVGKHYHFDNFLEIARLAQECASCALQASYLGGVEERRVQRQNLTDNMLHRYEHLSRCIKGEASYYEESKGVED